MKNAKPILLLASSLLLVGCSQSDQGSSSVVPPTGSEVSEEAMTIHYAKALEAMDEAKAVGMALTGEAKLNYSVESSLTQSEETKTYSKAVKAEISNLSASFGMKKDGDDVKMSAKASANYAYESSVTGTLFASEPSLSYSGNASVSTYYADKTIYIDQTGLSSIISIFNSDPKRVDLKRKQSVTGPSFDWDSVDEALNKLSEVAASSDSIQAKDGTYSFVYTIDPNTLVDSPSNVLDFKTNVEGDVKVWLSFTEDGFSEAGLSANFGNVSSISGEGGWATTSGNSEKLEVSATLKATFSYGDKVTVEEVADPENYVGENTSTEAN